MSFLLLAPALASCGKVDTEDEPPGDGDGSSGVSMGFPGGAGSESEGSGGAPFDPTQCECNPSQPEPVPFECHCEENTCGSLSERLARLPTCDDPGKATYRLSNCDEYVVVNRSVLLGSNTDYVYEASSSKLIGVRAGSDVPTLCGTSGDDRSVSVDCRSCTVCSFNDDECATNSAGEPELPQ